METKPLLYGLVGFFIGGLLVSVAASTFDAPQPQNSNSMSHMTASLEGKKGDEYDKAFIANMITHHQGAVTMAKLSAKNAKHDEIKQLSSEIIAAQKKEISLMKQWQKEWGYDASKGMKNMEHDSEHMPH